MVKQPTRRGIEAHVACSAGCGCSARDKNSDGRLGWRTSGISWVFLHKDDK